jgi:hypothetical protein
MRPRTMVAINLAGTVTFISVFFWIGRDHSPMMLLRWIAFFGATLIFPMRLSGRVEAALAQLPKPVPPELRRAATYPVWVGLMTLGAALALFDHWR